MVRSKSCREPAVSAAPARSERAVSGRGDGGAGATPPRDVDGGAADGAYVHFADEAAWKASGQRFWAASENLRGSQGISVLSFFRSRASSERASGSPPLEYARYVHHRRRVCL